MDFSQNSSSLPEPGSLESFGIGIDSQGLPTSDSSSTNPLVSQSNPDQTQHKGLIASIEAFAGAAVADVEAVVKTGYGGVKTVAGDVAGGVEGVVGYGVSQVVLILAVVGVALYFIGTTGAVKISR